MQISDNATVIAAHTAEQEIKEIDVESGDIVLSSQSLTLASVVENDYIVMGSNSKAEYGLLRKIVAKTTNADGEVVLKTE